MVMLFSDAEIWNILYGFLSKFIILMIIILTIVKIIKLVWYYYITLIWTIKDGKLSDLSLPPGTLGYPLIGETIGFVLKNAEFYKERQIKYGRVYKTHVLGRPTIRVSGADNLRTILTGENTLVTPQWPPSVRQILGKESLSMMSGVEHSVRRRIVVKAFDQTALTAYIPYVQDIIRRGLRRWCDKGQIFGYTESKTVAFSIAARVFAGLNLSDERSDHLSTVFLQMIAGMFSLPFKFKGSGLYKGLKAKEYLINQLDLHFKEVEKEGSDQDFSSAVHHLLNSQTEGGESLSRYAIAEAVLEMLFAGHDTVTSQMCSILMLLGKNKKYVDTLRKELEAEGLLDISKTNSDITLSVLNRLEYLNMVIKETLRLCPPVGAGYRRVLKTFELEGYRIPEGWTLAYGIRDTHLTSSLYIDSDTFDPDRWKNLQNLDKAGGIDSKNDRFNFCPFGGGARTCVGKEFAKLALRLFVIELVKTCDWTLLNESAPMKYIPVPRAADNLPLKIHLRT